MSHTILERLQVMAARLGLTSNQIMLVFAANAGWTNFEMTTAAVNILQKLAKDNKIDLYDEDPFIVQLISKGVILPSEAICFGWKVKDGATEISDRGENSTTGLVGNSTTGNTTDDKPLGGCY